MTTRRESYVEALMHALSADAQLQALGVKVERSIYDAVSSDEPRVLVVHRGRDTPTPDIGVTTRACIFMLTAVVRDAAPDRASDSIFELAHPVVMRFDADGLMGVLEGPTDEPRAADAEGGIGVVTIQYLFQYQTPPEAL
ncbi:hypothetical protein [Paraburkholderia sp. J41]|uniref:hypothetical protein n=1 Tax=Paraburkholderia sp. J41 TaxID=2805433 RepID=UPI002AC357F9|nr:hypothetical protein [Paraburkholderia sp. J41]